MVENLYQKYYPELVRWCRSMTENQQTAEELVQEAFLRAMLHQSMLEQMKELQCRSWLYRTIKNLYVDHIRRSSRETVVNELPETPQMPEAITQLEWETLLNSLPDIEGVLFSLRHLEGYNSTQLGELFSLPPGTVRSKLSSARKHLKEALGGKKYV